MTRAWSGWMVALLSFALAAILAPGAAAAAEERVAGQVVVGFKPSARQLEDVVGEAIADAEDTLFVVAAGNYGVSVDDEPRFPCAYPLDNVLCVGATDARGTLADFSNYGSTSVDLVAPGVDVLAPWPERRSGGTHRPLTGTSFASVLRPRRGKARVARYVVTRTGALRRR